MGATPSPVPDWRYRAVVWSVCAAAAGYLFFSLWIGWSDVSDAVHRVGLSGVLASLALSLVNYGLRFVRWQQYLRAMNYEVPWRPSLWIYLAGFALTTTPGKAGEVLRSVLLRRQRVPYPVSLAAMVSERLSDVTAIILLALLALAEFPSMQGLVIGGAVVVVAVALVVSSNRFLSLLQAVGKGESHWARLWGQGVQVLLQARTCHGPRVLALALTLGVLAWAAEAWAFHLILQWMGLELTLASSVFIYSISMLAGAASLLPGGLGGAEAAMVGLLVWKGVPAADAIAATILIRMATLWFAVAIGCIAMLRGPDAVADSPGER